MSKKKMTIEQFATKRTETATKFIIQSLETPNPKQLAKFILEINANGLAKIVEFTSKFVIQYSDPIFQNQIFDIILRKIEIGSTPEKLDILKTEVLLSKAKAIIAINSTEERTQIKLENATEALKLLENANALQNHNITALIEDTTKALITMHPNPIEAFNLAKYSVEFRKTNLDPEHPSILEAYITTAQVGHIIGVRAIKIEAMQYADIAYNMALQLENKTHAATALEFLASIYKDFGDPKKASLLLEQSTSLKTITLKKIEYSKEQIDDVIPMSVESSRSLEIIKKHGISDDLTLTIKQKIQVSVLNPVHEASAQGKWINKVTLFEYGVSGYLNKEFISKTLGPVLNIPENVEVALMLGFEAINLGIMSNPMMNPLCAVAFVQKYPELVPTILAKHPEFFIDGHILNATLLNASDYGLELLGKDIAVNGSYNAYLETVMMPIIAHRLNTNVLEPVFSLIKAGKWDLSTQKQLLYYASEDYLTDVGAIYTSTLGQNLSNLDDALNISRILIFKVLLDAITEYGSKNYAPAEVFAKNYPDLIKRILDDHPDYITNLHIIDICRQAIIAPPQLKDIEPTPVEELEVPVLGEGVIVNPLLITIPEYDVLPVELEVPVLGEGIVIDH